MMEVGGGWWRAVEVCGGKWRSLFVLCWSPSTGLRRVCVSPIKRGFCEADVGAVRGACFCRIGGSSPTTYIRRRFHLTVVSSYSYMGLQLRLDCPTKGRRRESALR